MTLHAAAERWVAHLKKRQEAGDVSEDYVLRIEMGTVARIKELTDDVALHSLGKIELGDIRVAFQSKRKRDGSLRERSTIKTELRHVRTLLGWPTRHPSASNSSGLTQPGAYLWRTARTTA